MATFTLEIVQAVSDWQRGGDHNTKVKRGAALKKACAGLPSSFCTWDGPCYRQEAHKKDRVWQLLADNRLPETTAAWTTDLGIAKTFKGGVPPEGLRGVIFKLHSPAASVVVNLSALYTDADFHDACERHRGQIPYYGDGIGRYGDSQKEVVLEIASLDQASIHAYGGYSSSREDLAELYFGRVPSDDDLAAFDQLCVQANVGAGAWWLTETGTQAVLKLMEPHVARLRTQRQATTAAPAR